MRGVLPSRGSRTWRTVFLFPVAPKHGTAATGAPKTLLEERLAAISVCDHRKGPADLFSSRIERLPRLLRHGETSPLPMLIRRTATPRASSTVMIVSKSWRNYRAASGVNCDDQVRRWKSGHAYSSHRRIVF